MTRCREGKEERGVSLGNEEYVRKPDSARRRKGMTMKDLESSFSEFEQGYWQVQKARDKISQEGAVSRARRVLHSPH